MPQCRGPAHCSVPQSGPGPGNGIGIGAPHHCAAVPLPLLPPAACACCNCSCWRRRRVCAPAFVLGRAATAAAAAAPLFPPRSGVRTRVELLLSSPKHSNSARAPLPVALLRRQPCITRRHPSLALSSPRRDACAVLDGQATRLVPAVTCQVQRRLPALALCVDQRGGGERPPPGRPTACCGTAALACQSDTCPPLRLGGRLACRRARRRCPAVRPLSTAASSWGMPPWVQRRGDRYASR